MSVKSILLIIIAFILGSIPFGVIVAKQKGINLKKVGSGNIGATNVLRSVDKISALLTLLGDILKGTAAVALGRYFSAGPVAEGVIGFSAILGHNFSVFLKFRGGKGVATSFGVLLIYSPKIALITFIIWLAIVLMTKYSSLGAITAFGLLPVNTFVFDYTEARMGVSIAIAVLILARHANNISRFIKGSETKIGEPSS